MWGFDERSEKSIDHSTDASCRPEHLYSHCFGCHFCTCLLIYAAYSHQTLLHALLLALALPDKHCSSSSSFYTFPCPALFAPPLLHIIAPSSFLCLSFCLLCPTSSSPYKPSVCLRQLLGFLLIPLFLWRARLDVVLPLARHRLNLCGKPDTRATPSFDTCPCSPFALPLCLSSSPTSTHPSSCGRSILPFCVPRP